MDVVWDWEEEEHIDNEHVEPEPIDLEERFKSFLIFAKNKLILKITLRRVSLSG